MRIHSDTLTYADMARAALAAHVTFTRLSEHGSKKRDHAFEFILSGDSRRQQNGGDQKAATWDQWGVFFESLFEKDPEATCWAYRDAGDFGYRTFYRFEDGWPEDAHGDHRFRPDAPYTQKCAKCSARCRWQ